MHITMDYIPGLTNTWASQSNFHPFWRLFYFLINGIWNANDLMQIEEGICYLVGKITNYFPTVGRRPKKNESSKDKNYIFLVK